uniref:ferroxidase n=1 Tax=Latimeria chalumnae TaxID=7897 RepID=H3ADM4_LATCH
GAFYPDGTKGGNKKDDFVPPGGSHMYTWEVKEQFAPTEGDPNCLTWIYHSHIDAPKDISSGLIGGLLTCKKGRVLDNITLIRRDIDKDFILMFSVVDENHSWYLDENINTYCSKPSTVDKGDEDFKESNKMHAVNGYLYGNLPGLQMCVNESVSWHLFGMGNEVDIHSAYFHGHSVTNKGHRTDVINLFPATFVTAEMVTKNVGKWLLSCQVNDHIQAGMQELYEVEACNRNVPEATLTGRKREYFIAAEKLVWNYGPLGYNKFTNQFLNASGSDSEPFFKKSADRIGGEYWKVHYTEFTDETFTTKKMKTDAETHLGLLGPVIKAEVGDTILITFMNKADRNYSIQPHGVFYGKESEGTAYADGFSKQGSSVQPGSFFTYKWTVPKHVGPTATDPSCLTYLYYSAVDPVMDTNSGLVGPLVICKLNHLNEGGSQKQIDHEFYLLFTVFDENLSWYLETNIQAFAADPSSIDTENEEFQESNKMHAINGYMFGNLPGLEMCKGDNVSWHIIGLGTEIDIHGVYFQGNTIHINGMNRDTINLFPHTTATAFMQPDDVGTFKVNCRTNDHHIGGMKEFYYVSDCANKSIPEQAFGTMRTFYIAAEEVEWDFSPDRSWELEKHNTTEGNSYGDIFISKGSDQIGSSYKKVIYREYTDGGFTEHKPRSPQEEHLGILGPLIRAEIGDSILIVFKNKATRPYSVHAHGVKQVDAGKRLKMPNTLPGEIRTYRWDVPERSGPGEKDPNCISWVYYSTTNFGKDTYSGLIGPLITCRKGTLNKNGLRQDVDREFALLFMVFDENESWYLEENIENYLHKAPDQVNMTEEFLESNKLHAINGKLYGNLHGLVMIEDEKTDWYLLGLGNEIDMHTVHFHGQSFIFKTDKEHRGDVYDLFPGTFQTVELVAEHPGTWLLHCHVAHHIHAGMETTFTVLQRSDKVKTTEDYPRNSTLITNDYEKLEVEFLGHKLDKYEVKAALISLFTIGVILLATLLLLLICTLTSSARRQ